MKVLEKGIWMQYHSEIEFRAFVVEILVFNLFACVEKRASLVQHS